MAEGKLTEAQLLAATDRGGSLLVSAAAGSGKTKVLVERLFRYITEDRCHVDDFLIITYTRAAAAELRSKIASELSMRLAQTPEDVHLRRQLLRVYQADIKTVDAFCTALLRENAHLLAEEGDEHCLTPDFKVLDDSEAKLLRGRVLDRVLERFYEQLDEGGALLADTLGAGRDDSALLELVLELHDKLQSHADPDKWLQRSREQWEMPEGAFDGTVYAKELLLDIRRKAEHWERLLISALAQMSDCAAVRKGYAAPFAAAAERFAALREASQSGWENARTAADGLVFPRLGAVKDADGGEVKARMKTLWDAGKSEAKDLQSELSVSGEEAMEDLRAVAPAMCALLRLLEDFGEAYRREKLRKNAADFSDQEHLALRILTAEGGTPTELGRQVAARYREILVDEYQDTNEVQNAIFRAVSREGRNLFTVGDVKQSIYRFRLADPSIFLRKYRAFPPCGEAEEGEGRKILLSRNFRSRREVLDAANFVFRNIMSVEMGEMEYGEEEQLYFGAKYDPERKDCGTEFHLIAAEARQGDADQPVKRGVAEARFTAQKIRELLDGRFPVTGEDGTLRPCRPEDIVILMRSPGGRLPVFSEALSEQGIPCSFEERGDFFSSMEISVLFGLLQLIDNPRQDVPLISVLRSPVFGFSPDRLAEIRGKTPEGDFYHAVSQDGGEDCRSFLEALSRLRVLAQDRSVCRLLWHIYNEFNVLGIFGAMDDGRSRKENLIALAAHAEQFEASGYRGVFAFVTQLRSLLESGDAPQTRGASGGTGVRLMSVHKSKGLEFPIVFLADLDRVFSRQDFSAPVLVHPKLGLGPRRVDLTRMIRYPTLARRAVEERLRRESLAEEERILYVAMTRAKEKLILVDALYHAPGRLKRLLPLASCPALPEAVSACRCPGDWILLPLLCRPEAKPLRDLAEMEADTLYTGDTAPWRVVLHSGEEFRDRPVRRRETGTEAETEQQPDLSLLDFVYPYGRETLLPAKLTATQLKGREVDEEIAEHAARTPYLRPLSQPNFRRQGSGLTPAEKGTAAHLALQYLDFSDFDAAGQVEALVSRRLLTPEQGAAVDVGALLRFLRSPLAEEIRTSRSVLREYRFTLLMDAKDFDPAAVSDDQILLQGVADCCFETAEGLTVVDFKTDRVRGKELALRAEQYRPQLMAYSAALTRVLEKPVVRRVLYFLDAGETVFL